MTFGARTFQGMSSANGSITSPSITRNNTSISPGTRSTSASFQSDGTITVGAGTGTVSTTWVNPAPVTGIGASWWIKFHLVSSSNSSGTGVISGVTMDTWISLASVAGISFNSGSSANEYTAGVQVQFSPDGGGTLSGTGGINIDIGYAP